REREVEQTESRPDRNGTPAREPLRRGVHHLRHRGAGLWLGLEHDHMAERLAPVALVATIDDGHGTGDDLPTAERPEGTDLALLRERRPATEDGEVELERRGPVRAPVGVHPIVKEHELLERVLARGGLDPDAHWSSLKPNPSSGRTT